MKPLQLLCWLCLAALLLKNLGVWGGGAITAQQLHRDALDALEGTAPHDGYPGTDNPAN
jgi:hypothetical protein